MEQAQPAPILRRSTQIKEEEKLSKIFEAAKAANQEGLKTFDEMDMEHAMDSQGIAQIEPVANVSENTEQVEQAETTTQPAPILRRSTRIAELNEKWAEPDAIPKAVMYSVGSDDRWNPQGHRKYNNDANSIR